MNKLITLLLTLQFFSTPLLAATLDFDSENLQFQDISECETASEKGLRFEKSEEDEFGSMKAQMFYYNGHLYRAQLHYRREENVWQLWCIRYSPK